MKAFIEISGHILTINKIQTQVFIEYRIAGTFFSENKIEEIPEKKHPDPADLSEWEFAYSFFEREYIEINGERVYLGKKKNISKLFYPQGEVFTLQEVKEKFPEKESLIWNMEANGWHKVVKHRARGFHPFDEETDEIVPKERFYPNTIVLDRGHIKTETNESLSDK